MDKKVFFINGGIAVDDRGVLTFCNDFDMKDIRRFYQVSNHNSNLPYAVHYTRGGPWFQEWQDVEFANDWIKERDEYLSKKFSLL